MKLSSLILSALLACTGSAGAESPIAPRADPSFLNATAEETARAKDLVRQLGSPSYREREAASRDLAKMGRLAVPALRAALASESRPEIQRRIDLVLPAAEAADFQARLACFRLDAEGEYEHQLQGWAKFKAALGNDKPVRDLFVELAGNKAYEKLLGAADRTADELGASLIARYAEMQRGAPKGHVLPTAGELVALAFLESVHTDIAMPLIEPGGLRYSLANYLNLDAIQAAMIPGRTPGPHAAALRKIMVRWLDSRESGTGLLQALSCSQTWQMPAATARYAAKLLAAGTVYDRSYGLEKLGTHSDGAKYLPEIAKLIDDSNLLRDARPDLKDDERGVLLGDFALGVAILLSGQKHADYGLEVADPAVYARVQPGNYYFQPAKADDRRKAAIAKFRAWLADRPGKVDR